jgi:hypothetical protein
MTPSWWTVADPTRYPSVTIRVNDPEGPTALIGRCEWCGGEMYMGLPASAANVVQVTKVFVDMHKGCHLAPATPSFL